MATKEEIAREGVSDAWDYWIAQHPVSVVDIVEEGIEKAFRRWLDDNKDAIIEAIARRRKL